MCAADPSQRWLSVEHAWLSTSESPPLSSRLIAGITWHEKKHTKHQQKYYGISARHETDRMTDRPTGTSVVRDCLTGVQSDGTVNVTARSSRYYPTDTSVLRAQRHDLLQASRHTMLRECYQRHGSPQPLPSSRHLRVAGLSTPRLAQAVTAEPALPRHGTLSTASTRSSRYCSTRQ